MRMQTTHFARMRARKTALRAHTLFLFSSCAPASTSCLHMQIEH